MTYRDDTEALRERVAELENKLASTDEAEMARHLNKVTRELVRTKRELSHARDERDKAVEDHRRLVAKRARGPLIPPGAFQRSAVFGAALAATFAAITGAVLLFGAIADGCSHPLHAGFIVARIHHEEYTTQGESCTGSGSSRICTPTITPHPERWTVIVADGEQEIEDELPVEQWRQTTNGEWYCVLPPCEPAPEPYDFNEVDQ